MTDKVNDFLRSKADEGYTNIMLSVYSSLTRKYGYSIRISDIFQLLKDSFGVEDFEILDTRVCNNGPLESYLIDELISWQKGEQVNFSEIHRVILREVDFTSSEKEMFVLGNIEERLWAIYTAISRPLDENILNNNIN